MAELERQNRDVVTGIPEYELDLIHRFHSVRGFLITVVKYVNICGSILVETLDAVASIRDP